MKGSNVIMFVFNHFENDSRVLKEATSLVKNGFNVTLYAIWKEGLEKEEEINGFQLKRMTINPIHKVIFGKSGLNFVKNILLKKKEVDQNKKPSVKSNVITYQRKNLSSSRFIINTISKFFTYQSMYSKVISDVNNSQKDFDIIHCHDMSTLYLGNKLKKKYKKPFIYDSHELFVERDKPYVTPNWYKNLQIKFEKKRIKEADGVITVSNSIGHEFVSRYGIEYPVLIYNTPYYNEASNSISIREKLNLSEDKKIIMYSGGFTIGRGLEKLVESIKFLPKDFHLVLLGFGKPEFVSILENIVVKEKAENQFDMYGPVPSNEVPLYLSSANICVSPIQNVALNNYFSCPNKVFEYIQARVPMALSNFPELQRIIDEEKIGVTFDPIDAKNIADSMVTFLNDQEKYKEAKENLNASAEKYNWENEEKKLLNLYSRVLSN